MAAAYVTVNGTRATRVRLRVPRVGVWFADVAFDESTSFSGRVTLAIGEATFIGTVDPRASGSWQLGSKCRIVAGAGAWGNTIPAKHFHNDASVKSSQVITQAAAAVGETVSIDTSYTDAVKADFVRAAGPARSVLRGRDWWVDSAGVTQVRARPTQDATDYDLLEFDPMHRTGTLAVDDPRTVVIGSVLRGRLDVPVTVAEIDLLVTKESTRMMIWGST